MRSCVGAREKGKEIMAVPIGKPNYYDEMWGKYPIDYDKVLDAIDDKKLLELRKVEFSDLLKTLFDES